MSMLTKNKKVGEMTTGEPQELIRNTLNELIDPDYGLELRPEVEESLRRSIKQKERGEGITLESVKKKLGIK